MVLEFRSTCTACGLRPWLTVSQTVARSLSTTFRKDSYRLHSGTTLHRFASGVREWRSGSRGHMKRRRFPGKLTSDSYEDRFNIECSTHPINQNLDDLGSNLPEPGVVQDLHSTDRPSPGNLCWRLSTISITFGGGGDFLSRNGVLTGRQLKRGCVTRALHCWAYCVRTRARCV